MNQNSDFVQSFSILQMKRDFLFVGSITLGKMLSFQY